jgi:hypothetical protein
MSNAILTEIKLPSGTIYDLHDKRVDNLNNWSYVVCTKASNTPKDVVWGDPAITGTLVASASTMYKIYLVPSANGVDDIYDEYITINSSGTTYIWEMFGNTKLPDMTQYVKNASGHAGETAGSLAYKNSASGSGTVAVPKTYSSSFSGTAGSVSVTGTTTGSVNLTKSNVEITPSATGTAANKYTPAGTVTQPTFSGTGVRLQTDSQVLTGASFTGSSMNSTGNFTPSGSISVGTGTANYTPSGSINVTTSNTTKYVASSATGGGSVTAGTACTMPTYTVSGTTLEISAGTPNTPTSVTLPSFSSQSIATGISTKTFTGTGAELIFTGTEGSVSVTGTTTGSVSPTKSNVTVSPTSGTATYTPGGSVSQPTFSGTSTYFKTASEVGTAASFTGASMTSTGTFTPAGSVTTTTDTTETKTVSVTVS